jgi:hypothetical protein
MGQQTTSQSLREQLMAPEAIARVHALHALELALEAAPASPVAAELEAFTARGIPYYAPEDQEYLDWVTKAVSYLEALHMAGGKPAARGSASARGATPPTLASKPTIARAMHVA